MVKLTVQETFDKICEHLLSQGERAESCSVITNIPVRCLYHLQKEDKLLKCAVGCLIPDELYSPELEGYGVRSGKLITILEPITEMEPMDLMELQDIHDMSEPKNWPRDLRIFAYNHSLSLGAKLSDALGE